MADENTKVQLVKRSESDISSFDSFLQPIAKKQESYIKDTTDFVRFIENTPIPENAEGWHREQFRGGREQFGRGTVGTRLEPERETDQVRNRDKFYVFNIN